MNYYNEIDPFCCQWLENLMEDGLIAKGIIDGRSIAEVEAKDLRGFTQCHFFAGLGGWPLALDIAGWPRDRPVWTGSCPCQPFSAAGGRKGESDKRHLWPDFHLHIFEGQPPTVFGEQVAGKDGLTWLSGVRTDLEECSYEVGAADLCAAGTGEKTWTGIVGEDGELEWEGDLIVGAPHIRQRLYWAADRWVEDAGPQHPGRGLCGPVEGVGTDKEWAPGELGGSSGVGGMGNSPGDNQRGSTKSPMHREGLTAGRSDSGAHRLPHTSGPGLPQRERQILQGTGRGSQGGTVAQSGSSDFYRDWEIAYCLDGKARRVPVKPSLFPLADGFPGRLGVLRAGGNAIHCQLAADFIRAYCEARGITLCQ
jgi:DNA (cytosine-5)-methyltransferase 1